MRDGGERCLHAPAWGRNKVDDRSRLAGGRVLIIVWVAAVWNRPDLVSTTPPAPLRESPVPLPRPCWLSGRRSGRTVPPRLSAARDSRDSRIIPRAPKLGSGDANSGDRPRPRAGRTAGQAPGGSERPRKNRFRRGAPDRSLLWQRELGLLSPTPLRCVRLVCLDARGGVSLRLPYRQVSSRLVGGKLDGCARNWRTGHRGFGLIESARQATKGGRATKGFSSRAAVSW